MLGDSADLLLDRWAGDLRQLRDEAEREPKKERGLLEECKGMGDVGVDDRALSTAQSLGLETGRSKVAGLGDRSDLPRLTAALVRCGLSRDEDEVLQAARSG